MESISLNTILQPNNPYHVIIHASIHFPYIMKNIFVSLQHLISHDFPILSLFPAGYKSRNLLLSFDSLLPSNFSPWMACSKLFSNLKAKYTQVYLQTNILPSCLERFHRNHLQLSIHFYQPPHLATLIRQPKLLLIRDIALLSLPTMLLCQHHQFIQRKGLGTLNGQSHLVPSCCLCTMCICAGGEGCLNMFGPATAAETSFHG